MIMRQEVTENGRMLRWRDNIRRSDRAIFKPRTFRNVRTAGKLERMSLMEMMWRVKSTDLAEEFRASGGNLIEYGNGRSAL